MYRPKWPFLIILIVYGPGVVIVNCWDRFCTLCRAPRTKETLPDFREWCRVTRHPRAFSGLTGCQRTPGKWGVIIACALRWGITLVGVYSTELCSPQRRRSLEAAFEKKAKMPIQ